MQNLCILAMGSLTVGKLENRCFCNKSLLIPIFPEHLRDRRDRLRSQKTVNMGVGENVNLQKLFRHALVSQTTVSILYILSC